MIDPGGPQEYRKKVETPGLYPVLSQDLTAKSVKEEPQVKGGPRADHAFTSHEGRGGPCV